MQSILLVEGSQTRRYALLRALGQAGHDVIECGNYWDAAQMLEEPGAEDLLAVVLGWEKNEPELSEMLKETLSRKEMEAMPLLFVSDEDDAALTSWLQSRKFSQVFPYAQQEELCGFVSRLVRTSSEKSKPLDRSLCDKLREDDLPGLRVLLVDDTRAAQERYQRVLGGAGYQVTLASSPKEAMILAARSEFDLAIVDYFLLQNDGDEIFRQFREDPAYAGIRCVVLISTYLDQAVQHSLEIGAVECVFKTETDMLFLARVDALARQIQLQKRAYAERHRFESILGSIGEGVYGVDMSGNITFINPAGRNMLGFHEPEEFLGKSAKELFQSFEGQRRSDEPEQQDELTLAYSSGEPLEQWETVFIHKNGQKVQVVCTVAPLEYSGCRQGSVVAFRDISDRKRLERRLIWQATRDPLTDLYNRRFFEKALTREVNKVQQGHTRTSALLYLDFDKFKYLNDTAGHDAGDKLLVEASVRLKGCVRSSDAVARLGGDEFAVILRGVEGNEPLEIAENIRKGLQEVAYISEDISFKLSCSVGVALIEQTTTEKEVLANADVACGIAKRKGRNQSHLYDDAGDMAKAAMNEEIVWSIRLQEALDNDDFRLLYQPILPISEVDLDYLPSEANRLWASLSHLPDHYEVLLRLDDKDNESISPQVFLSMAERFNLIHRIDLWVVGTALRKLEALRRQGREASFSVNLSGATLSDADSLRAIQRLLSESSLNPSSITFEITETSAIEKLEGARQFIEEMRALGWRFSLDDFGTGFSSFSQLKYLPVDVVKIDGQFIQGMADDPIDRAIVNAISEIAQSLGIDTVAEYVETPETLIALQASGVTHAQGFYISKPLTDIKERADSTSQVALLSEPVADF